MNATKQQQRAFKKMLIHGVKAFAAFQEWRGFGANGSTMDLGTYVQKALATALGGKAPRKIEITNDARQASSSIPVKEEV